MAVKKENKYIRVDKYSCKFTNITGPITKLKIKESYGKVLNNACWANIGSRTTYRNGKSNVYDAKSNVYVLITDSQYGKRSKFLEKVVMFINDITPCRIVIENGEKCILYKLLSHHSANLFLLNLVRMLWYTPSHQFGDINESTERFFRELFDIYNAEKTNKEFDHILLLTRLIRDRGFSKFPGVRSKSAYTEGDHSFFYYNVVPKTNKEFLSWANKRKSNKFNSFSSFLKAITIK